MFPFWKKETEEKIYAPVEGKSLPIEQVPDKVFAGKLLGDGVGFFFEGDTVYAPCGGEITLLADTGHAFGIRTRNGTEILVHIGLNTVELKGEGFQVLAKEHDKIKAHAPVIRVDRALMAQKQIDLTIPMIITNQEDYELTFGEYGEVKPEDTVMITKRK